MYILDGGLTDHGVRKLKCCKRKTGLFYTTFQRNSSIVFVALLCSLQASCSEAFDSEEEPEVELTIINSQDIRDVAADDFDWEDRRAVNLRQPFWRVEQNVYELHYFPTVWTERFEQVRSHPVRAYFQDLLVVGSDGSSNGRCINTFRIVAVRCHTPAARRVRSHLSVHKHPPLRKTTPRRALLARAGRTRS
jgi:hypothetical protein